MQRKMLGPFSALKVYLLEYIYLNNALLTVALLNYSVEYLYFMSSPCKWAQTTRLILHMFL